MDTLHLLMKDPSHARRWSEVIVFPYLSMYDPFSSGGSILGSGFLALVDEGSISSSKAVGGDCIFVLVRV